MRVVITRRVWKRALLDECKVFFERPLESSPSEPDTPRREISFFLGCFSSFPLKLFETAIFLHLFFISHGHIFYFLLQFSSPFVVLSVIYFTACGQHREEEFITAGAISYSHTGNQYLPLFSFDQILLV